MSVDEKAIETKLRSFLTENLSCDFETLPLEQKLMKDCSIETDAYEWVMEKFELEFEITGRIGLGEIQLIKNHARAPFFIRMLRAILRQPASHKAIKLPDLTLGELVRIAKSGSWPNEMLL